MLICKYTRLDRAAFVPHLDTLRAVTMGVRRIGAAAQYSEGFNPHMKIFFGQPLPIGTESACEYFCLYSDDDPESFAARMNASLPDGLRIVACARMDRDPNVANLMDTADYTVTMRDIQPFLRQISSFCEGETCEIEYEAKGRTHRKDVKSLIVGVEIPDERTVRWRLKCGNENLRCDRLMRYLCDIYGFGGGYDVRKTRMYDRQGTDLDILFYGRSI